MPIVPEDRLGKIEFYEAHIAPWTANAAAIGLAPTSVTALGTLTTAARAAYNAAEAARQAARAATQNFYDKVRAMHSNPGAGSDMINTIKVWAESKNDPNVYVLAQIPAPTPPSALPPPGIPFEYNVGLLQDGSLELKWKCSNPVGSQGTIYEVRRRIGSGPGGLFEFVGATGQRTFIDATLPEGSSPVTYQVTGVRSTSRGNPSQFTVNFGVGGGGGAFMITSVSEESQATGKKNGVKLAA